MNLRIKTKESLINTVCLDGDITKLAKIINETYYYLTYCGKVYEIDITGDEECLVKYNNDVKMTVYKDEVEEIY